MKPGVYANLSMQEYLDIEAVSAGLLDTLMQRCPRAAWHASWLNPKREREASEIMDIGTIAHSMLLEGGAGAVTVIDPAEFESDKGNIPTGWTTKAIREARDAARAAGKIPVLKPAFEAIANMHATCVDFIASTKDSEPHIFDAFARNGESELTLVWEDGPTLCKARCDRINSARTLIVNYKTTGGSVEPDHFGRRHLLDYDLGASFYISGALALFGKEPEHVFLCQETDAPHLCSLIGLDPPWQDFARQKAKFALRFWEKCVATNEFPGYPSRVCYPTLPVWEQARLVDRQIVDGIPYGEQA